jgi:hypothetical protein
LVLVLLSSSGLLSNWTPNWTPNVCSYLSEGGSDQGHEASGAGTFQRVEQLRERPSSTPARGLLGEDSLKRPRVLFEAGRQELVGLEDMHAVGT